MAAPLLAGELEPARERALADPVAPRDLGLAALPGLVGRERPLAQVGGVGTRHRSPPVGVKATSTADRGAGSVDGRAIRSRAYDTTGEKNHNRMHATFSKDFIQKELFTTIHQGILK